MQQQAPDWWGDITLEPGKVACCSVGPLTLTLRLLGSEWHIASRRVAIDPDHSHAHLELSDSDPLADSEFQRLVFSTAVTQAYLNPALADRPVVSRPSQPLLVAPGQQVTVYVHAPLWVQIRRSAESKPLLDIPVAQLSDTWFGASTREGELCYASRTQGRLQLDSIPLRPHRAVTPVHLHNDASDALKLEKLNLPEPYLALYAADNGLWTDAVELVRNSAGEMAPVQVTSGVPPQAVNGRLVCAPRKTTEKGGLLSSFTALFG
jgi:hypothetical protein